MGMESGLPRDKQDIVQVALKLEREIPVDLSFGGGDRNRLARLLARDDLSILHIDTHGGPDGRAILVSRGGAMLTSDEMRAQVRVPLVLLFGCHRYHCLRAQRAQNRAERLQGWPLFSGHLQARP